MGLTILDDSRRRVIVRTALVVLTFSPAITLSALGDPYQAPRALAVAFAAFLMALAAGPLTDGARRVPRAVAISLAILSAAVVVATVANHPASSLWGVHGRFQGVVSFAILLAVAFGGWSAARQESGWLSGALCASVLVQAALVLTRALTTGTPDGAFGNRAVAAGWLSVGVAVAIASAIASAGYRRTLSWVTAAIGCLALGATGTRGAWIGLTLAVVTAFAASTSGRVRRIVAIAAVTSAALVLAGTLFGGAESAGKLSPTALTSGSASARLEIWRSTVAMIGDNALVGVGPGRFLYRFPRYETMEHARVEGPGVRADNAHDLVLQFAAETGVVGGGAALVLAAAALALGIRAARQRNGHAFVATVGLAAYVGQALTGVPAVETDALGWLLGGMAVAGSAVVLRDRVPGVVSRVARVAVPLLAAALTIATSVYLAANARYGSGLALFETGDLRGAATAHEAAIRRDPFTDVYRVASADAAFYLGGEALTGARSVVEDGLRFEPDSYDLLLARARLLSAEQQRASVIAQGYVEAVAAYPLDVTARQEAIGALSEAGRTDEAATMARELLRLVPEDPVAKQMVK